MTEVADKIEDILATMRWVREHYSAVPLVGVRGMAWEVKRWQDSYRQVGARLEALLAEIEGEPSPDVVLVEADDCGERGCIAESLWHPGPPCRLCGGSEYDEVRSWPVDMEDLGKIPPRGFPV